MIRKIFKNKFFSFFILIILVQVICKWSHSHTGGFKANKIIPPKNYRAPDKEMPLLSESEKNIFNQPYHFLDRGCQVYVFESSDQKYVIKFLRHHKYEESFWIKLISFSKVGREKKERDKYQKQLRLKQVYESYKMSYEELHPITETLYVHLGETDHLKKKIILIDRWGQKYSFDLDRMHFIVQKRAKKLKTEILKLYKTQDEETAKNLIDQYFEIIQFRTKKSIRDFDYNGYLRNKGIIDGKIVDIDLGGYKKSKLSFLEINNIDIQKYSFKFARWAKKNTPSLAPYIEKKAGEFLKEEKK